MLWSLLRNKGEDEISQGKVFTILVLCVCAFRLWFITTLPLSGDEAYHWEWSRHLAGGYYDHPGMTAYLIRLSTELFGRSNEFTVRFPAVLMLAGAACLVFVLGKTVALRSGRSLTEASLAGAFAGGMMLFAPVYAVLGVYMSTDPALIFFWALTLLTLYFAIVDGRRWLWPVAGIAMGLALHSKFLAFFLPLGVLLFCVFSARDRKILIGPFPYIAGVFTVLTLIPFFAWNARNEWATFMFNLVYRQKVDGFTLQHVPTYIGAQMLALSPGIFLYVFVEMVRSIRNGISLRQRSILFSACTSLAAVLYFTWTSFRCQVDPHWLAPAWIGAVVCLSVKWSRGGDLKSILVGRLRLFSIGLCLLITVAIHFIVHIPVRWLDFEWGFPGSSDRINVSEHAERFGWDELGRHVESVYRNMKSLQSGDEGVFIICDEYGFAADVAFYTPGQPETHLWSRRRKHGENYRYWDDFPSLKGQDAIFVTKDRDDMSKQIDILKKHFERIGDIEDIPIYEDGIKVRTFCLLRCYNFRGDYPYAQEVGR